MISATYQRFFVSPTLTKTRFTNKWNRLQFAFPLPAIAVLMLTAEAALAACPNNVASSPPRWSFTTIDWVYSGGLSSAQVGAGATAWNSRQNFTSVQAGSTWLDLNIFDNNSIGVNLGEATVWNQGNGGSPCYLRRSFNCAAVCYNTSRIYYTDIKLSNDNIGGAGTDWASIWGLSTSAAIDLVTKMVVSKLTYARWS